MSITCTELSRHMALCLRILSLDDDADGAVSAEEAQASAALRHSMQTDIVKISSKTSLSQSPAAQTHIQVCLTGVGLLLR